jgi:hypothetical protein
MIMMFSTNGYDEQVTGKDSQRARDGAIELWMLANCSFSPLSAALVLLALEDLKTPLQE